MKIKIHIDKKTAAIERGHSRAAASGGERISARSIYRFIGAFARNNQQGSALVEFALLLPMLLLLTTGILVFGVAMNNYMQLNNAVSVGARTLAVNGGMTLDPCVTASTAVINAAPNLNPSLLSFSYSLNGNAYSGTSCSSSSLTTGAAANLASGTTGTVTVTYPLNLSVFGNQYSTNGAVLSATASELVQ